MIPGGVMDALTAAARWIQVGLAVLGGLTIVLGAVLCVAALVRERAQHGHTSTAAARLLLARHLALALEFQLASDIIGTSLAPDWENIAELAAIAAIRTGLNYFLSRDMSDDRQIVGERRAA